MDKHKLFNFLMHVQCEETITKIAAIYDQLLLLQNLSCSNYDYHRQTYFQLPSLHIFCACLHARYR